MLIYLSERKIQNLCSEFNIDKGFIDSIMPDSIKTKWGIRLGVADGSIESQYAIQNTSHISQVLKNSRVRTS